MKFSIIVPTLNNLNYLKIVEIKGFLLLYVEVTEY